MIQAFLAGFFHGMRDGDFNTSFADLYEATTGTLETSELRDILKQLESENSNSDKFEVFGLKIPAEQITNWGITIILCVQLYLYMYLRNLKSPLESSDAAWEVGWFAANDARLPKIIFFVTVFILPLAAVALLSRHALNQRMQEAAATWSWHFVASRRFFEFIRDFKAVPILFLGCCSALTLRIL